MQNYYLSYIVLRPGTQVTSQVREFRTFKSTPIIALNDFHRSMQRTKEVDAKRKIVRPRLNADEYKIQRLFIRYSDSANDLSASKTVESDFDIPNTPNPVLKARVKKIKTGNVAKLKDAEFQFMADV